MVTNLLRDLRPQIAEIARTILGEPNKTLSSSRQLRFGTNGSVAVEIAGERRGEWFDHEAGVGGGPWELLTVKGHMTKGDPIGWLRSQLGIELAPKQKAERQIVAAYDYCDEHGDLLFPGLPVRAKDFPPATARRQGRLDMERQGSSAGALSPARVDRRTRRLHRVCRRGRERC